MHVSIALLNANILTSFVMRALNALVTCGVAPDWLVNGGNVGMTGVAITVKLGSGGSTAIFCTTNPVIMTRAPPTPPRTPHNLVTVGSGARRQRAATPPRP